MRRRQERIGLVTAYDSGFKTIVDLTLPRMKAICEEQGYELRAMQAAGCGRRAGWLKIRPILEALAQPFDWVLWIDADVLILRTDQRYAELFHQLRYHAKRTDELEEEIFSLNAQHRPRP